MANERSVTQDPTADRADPRCPSCGEPVGARASHCIHCWRDLPERADSAEYDEVTGGTHEISHATDEVTDATPEVRAPDDGGESLLERLGSGIGERRGSESGRHDADRRPRESGHRDADRPPVPSGRGTDGPTLLPAPPTDAERAGKFLGGLAAVGAGALVAGVSLPLTAVLLAAVAWAGSTVALARRRSGFDAMRYGSYNAMLTFVFGAFALAFAGGAPAFVPVSLAMVPVAASTLLVGGLGYSMGDPVED
jgi:hypothetical protein